MQEESIVRAGGKVITTLGLDPLSWFTALCSFTDATGKRTSALHSLVAQFPDVTSNDLSAPEIRHVLLRCDIIGTTMRS